MRRAYFEFRDFKQTCDTGYFPYTPPTQILHGLRRALDRIHAEGLAVLERIAAQLSDDVWVVAPETDQSGFAHSLSLSEPLRRTMAASLNRPASRVLKRSARRTSAITSRTGTAH